MGSSGVGKDSILRFARVNLCPDDRIAFAHRYITRPPDITGENHIALTREEFELRRNAGLFAFDWRAHDTLYGIGIEIEAWRQAGIAVVLNDSRKHYSTLSRDTRNLAPVLITARSDVLADRLERRGRESKADILMRLQRDAVLPEQTRITMIDNSGELEVAGAQFLRTLRTLAQSFTMSPRGGSVRECETVTKDLPA
jgi:ribose 1,5-bisphosphokinase